MSLPVLSTKLYIPPPSQKLLPRPRLVEGMLEGLDRKLTLISAPAGFGKTTLLSEFAAASPRPVAWLSLDPGDNDPVHFLTYLIAALQKASPGLGESLKASFQVAHPGGALPLPALLTTLLNEIAQVEQLLLLVLDDLHLITERQVHEALVFILDNLPPNLHLVVATRSDPPWPLPSQRARGQMSELRAADLRFTPTEAGDFLAEKMKLNLPPQQVNDLDASTEGWPAGLQLAAVALQSQALSRTESSNSAGDAAAFIRSFGGSHRFVADYLTGEVLQRQEPHVQEFLLHTSLLNRMNASLCADLMKLSGSEPPSLEACQSLLEYLENANLFVVPLDEQRLWYRYHHLFADLLRHRLQQKYPQRLALLHQAASAWYASQAETNPNSFLVEEALQHAQDAGDSNATAQLLDRFGEVFWQNGENTRLRQWIERLPAPALEGHANLNILYAWLLLTGGDYPQAREALDRAQTSLAQAEPTGSQSALHGKLAVVRAFLATFSGDFAAIIPAAQQALEHLSGSQSTWRTLAGIALGDALGLTGNSEAALQAYAAASASSRPDQNPYLALNAGVKLAMTQRQAGQLEQALLTTSEQLQIADRTGLQKTSMAGLLLAVKGEILVEWGDRHAQNLVEQGVRVCEQGAHIGYLGWSYLLLSRVYGFFNNVEGISQITRKFETLAPNLPPWLVSPKEALQALLWLAHGDQGRLKHWIQERSLTLADESMLHRSYEYLTYARILLAWEEYATAGAVLEKLRAAFISGGAVNAILEVLLVETLLHERQGDRLSAVQTLSEALRLAEPGRFQQTFLEEGPELRPVLHAAAAAGHSPQYANRLLAAFDEAFPEPSQAEAPLLSARELEVLRRMAEGDQNSEIASQLHISLNTVLFHSKKIFAKLGANSRTQAIARARELGIL